MSTRLIYVCRNSNHSFSVKVQFLWKLRYIEGHGLEVQGSELPLRLPSLTQFLLSCARTKYISTFQKRVAYYKKWNYIFVTCTVGQSARPPIWISRILWQKTKQTKTCAVIACLISAVTTRCNSQFYDSVIFYRKRFTTRRVYISCGTSPSRYLAWYIKYAWTWTSTPPLESWTSVFAFTLCVVKC